MVYLISRYWRFPIIGTSGVQLLSQIAHSYLVWFRHCVLIWKLSPICDCEDKSHATEFLRSGSLLSDEISLEWNKSFDSAIWGDSQTFSVYDAVTTIAYVSPMGKTNTNTLCGPQWWLISNCFSIAYFAIAKGPYGLDTRFFWASVWVLVRLDVQSNTNAQSETLEI